MQGFLQLHCTHAQNQTSSEPNWSFLVQPSPPSSKALAEPTALRTLVNALLGHRLSKPVVATEYLGPCLVLISKYEQYISIHQGAFHDRLATPANIILLITLAKWTHLPTPSLKMSTIWVKQLYRNEYLVDFIKTSQTCKTNMIVNTGMCFSSISFC